MALNPDWTKFLGLLVSNDVEFFIVGAPTEAYPAAPQLTEVIDLWVNPTAANAARIITAANYFGCGSLGLDKTDFTPNDQVIELAFQQQRVNLHTRLNPLSFGECWERRVSGDLLGVSISFLARADFIKLAPVT